MHAISAEPREEVMPASAQSTKAVRFEPIRGTSRQNDRCLCSNKHQQRFEATKPWKQPNRDDCFRPDGERPKRASVTSTAVCLTEPTGLNWCPWNWRRIRQKEKGDILRF